MLVTLQEQGTAAALLRLEGAGGHQPSSSLCFDKTEEDVFEIEEHQSAPKTDKKKTSGAWLSTKFLLDWCSAGHSFCTDVWQLVLHLACLGTTDKKETQTSKWLFALAGEPVNIKKQTASQHDAGVAEMPRACSQPCHRHTLQSHVQESTRILRGFILITTERSDISWIFMLPFPFPCTFVIFKKGTAGKAQAETLQEEDQYLLPLFLKAQKWDVLPSAVQGAPWGITYQRDSTEQARVLFVCFFPLPFSSFPSLGRSLGTRSTKAVCHLNFSVALVLYLPFSALSLQYDALLQEGMSGAGIRQELWASGPGMDLGRGLRESQSLSRKPKQAYRSHSVLPISTTLCLVRTQPWDKWQWRLCKYQRTRWILPKHAAKREQKQNADKQIMPVTRTPSLCQHFLPTFY